MSIHVMLSREGGVCIDMIIHNNLCITRITKTSARKVTVDVCSSNSVRMYDGA